MIVSQLPLDVCASSDFDQMHKDIQFRVALALDKNALLLVVSNQIKIIHIISCNTQLEKILILKSHKATIYT